jgi:hypothetical protein
MELARRAAKQSEGVPERAVYNCAAFWKQNGNPGWSLQRRNNDEDQSRISV